MSDRLLTPVQHFHAWLDRHPAARLAAGVALLALAIAAPLPGWLLDLWVVVALTGALGLATLIVAVGDELRPAEVLGTIPGFLRRFMLHKLALSVALLKAVLVGNGAGSLLEWVAQGALLGQPGVGLVALVAIVVARVALSVFPFPERLERSQATLEAELSRLEALGRQGRLTPRQVAQRSDALLEEVEVLCEGRQIFRLLRGEARLAAGLAAGFLGAVLASAILVKGWALPLAITTLAPYALAEAVLTGLPALVVAATLAQWLTHALEEAVAQARQQEPDPGAREAVPLLVVELGRELCPASRRGHQELAAQVRGRLARDLALPSPRVEVLAAQGLPARGFRIAIRGVAWRSGSLEAGEPVTAIADHVVVTARAHAGDLLTLECCRAWLDEVGESHPVTVALALETFGLARVQAVLQALLRERVPLRDLPSVLEALVAAGTTERSDEQVLAGVRRRLALAISLGLADASGTIRVLTLAPEWCESLADASRTHAVARDLAQGCRAQWAAACGSSGGRVALLVPAAHRARVAGWLAVSLPDITVVAPDELSSHHGLHVVGTVHRRVTPDHAATLSVLQPLPS